MEPNTPLLPVWVAQNWPLIILGTSVLFILLAITVFRVHAFLALICSALWVAVLSAVNPEATVVGDLFDLGKVADGVRQVSIGFGNTATGIALVIALAAIIGMCLMDSGAADQIVRKFMKVFGEKRAGLALMASGFFLSIPVFFDTVFFLLIPLARMLGIRTGKNYLYYVMAIAAGGAITHSIVPPTPGPLLVGGELELNLGTIMVAGFIAGLIPAFIALSFSKLLNRISPIAVREAPGSTLEELRESVDKPDEALPSFTFSIMPVILPAILLATFSFLDMVEKNKIHSDLETQVNTFIEENATPSEEITDAVRPHLLAFSQAIQNKESKELQWQHIFDAQREAAKILQTGEPEAVESEADKPEATQPEANQSGADEPVAAQPEANESEAAESEADQAEANEPEDLTFEAQATVMAVAANLDESGDGTAILFPKVMDVFANERIAQPENYSIAHAIFEVLGDKVVALGVGALLSILILKRHSRLSFKGLGEKWAAPLETAGVIILITSAGGAFGFMIRNTDIGSVIDQFAQQWQINYILLAWAVTAFIRIAQGSATVSMITGAGLMTAVLASGVDLGYHKLYIFLAIGFGSITCSWMNDSGFWIVCKLSGFSERETLKTWTPLLTLISLIGLLETWLCAKYFPLL